jgi:hypothetical protein
VNVKAAQELLAAPLSNAIEMDTSLIRFSMSTAAIPQ